MQNNYSRWENDAETIEQKQNESSRSKERKTIQIRKPILVGAIILFVGICVSIVAYANTSRSAEGLWVRAEDDSLLQGMTVEIKREGGILQGVIVSMGNTGVPFHVGQIKWSELKKIGIGRYTCYDLTYDYGSASFFYGANVTEIFVEPGGKGLTLINAGNGPSTGQYQTWNKHELN